MSKALLIMSSMAFNSLFYDLKKSLLNLVFNPFSLIAPGVLSPSTPTEAADAGVPFGRPKTVQHIVDAEITGAGKDCSKFVVVQTKFAAAFVVEVGRQDHAGFPHATQCKDGRKRPVLAPALEPRKQVGLRIVAAND